MGSLFFSFNFKGQATFHTFDIHYKYRESKGGLHDMKICISFRETTRDIILYNEIQNKEKYEKSEYVKNAIQYYIEYLKEKDTTQSHV